MGWIETPLFQNWNRKEQEMLIITQVRRYCLIILIIFVTQWHHFRLRDIVSSSISKLYFFLALSKISDMSSSSSSLSRSIPFVVLLLDSEALGVNPVEVSLAKKEKKYNKLTSWITLYPVSKYVIRWYWYKKIEITHYMYYGYIREVNTSDHLSCNLHQLLYYARLWTSQIQAHTFAKTIILFKINYT